MARNPKRKAKQRPLLKKEKGVEKPPAKRKSATKDASRKKSVKPAAQRRATETSMPPIEVPQSLDLPAGAEVLDRLWSLIESRKGANPETSHSARLLARGAPRVAQKLGEEATECVIEIVGGTHDGLIGESADLLYHLLVAWVHAGLRPGEVWDELHARERVSRRNETPGRAGALQRSLGSARAKTTKIP